MIILCRAHDEKNQGAKTSTGLTEWEIVNTINEAIYDKIIANYLDCIYFEGTLEQRIKALNSLSKVCDYSFSIECHCNWFSNPKTNGYSALVWHTSKKSIGVARYILTNLTNFQDKKCKGLNLVSKNRRWIGTEKEYGNAPKLAFLQDTPKSSIILEVGYLSNKEEAEWLSDEDNQYNLGLYVGQGIIDWYTKKTKGKII